MGEMFVSLVVYVLNTNNISILLLSIYISGAAVNY